MLVTKMTVLGTKQNGLINPSEPLTSKLFTKDDLPRNSICGSVMDEPVMNSSKIYVVYWRRWLVLGLFVLYSASNSLQWTQYTIIQDIVVKYYGVPSTLVSWTSMMYMVTYVPFIFPASWLLSKTVSSFISF